MSAAKKLRLLDNPGAEKERLADEKIELVGNGRAIAVAKFRELADKLERGELDGARVMDMSVGTSGANLNFNSVAFSSGAQLQRIRSRCSFQCRRERYRKRSLSRGGLGCGR